MLQYHAAYYEIEDGWYLGVVLDFPGVVTQGRTLDHARRMLRSALEDMADWLMEDGKAFPRPNSKARDKKAAVLEPVRLQAKAKAGAVS